MHGSTKLKFVHRSKKKKGNKIIMYRTNAQHSRTVALTHSVRNGSFLPPLHIGSLSYGFQYRSLSASRPCNWGEGRKPFMQVKLRQCRKYEGGSYNMTQLFKSSHNAYSTIHGEQNHCSCDYKTTRRQELLLLNSSSNSHTEAQTTNVQFH